MLHICGSIYLSTQIMYIILYNCDSCPCTLRSESCGMSMFHMNRNDQEGLTHIMHTYIRALVMVAIEQYRWTEAWWQPYLYSCEIEPPIIIDQNV